MSEYPIVVYTDGAASGNPGPGGWGAIVATPDGQVVELGGGKEETTNNAMEMTAAVEALRHLEGVSGRVEIYTDSTYLIRGITQWIWGWRKRGWTTAEGTPVANQGLWKALSALVEKRKADGPVEWKYVRGHVGTPGNERVDRIAVAFSQSKRPKLYRGPLVGYDVAIHDLPETGELPERKDAGKGGAKAVPHSYLSLLDGEVVRHRTWPDCERRVKGRSGAKFKKAMSASEETEILAAWGRPGTPIADDR